MGIWLRAVSKMETHLATPGISAEARRPAFPRGPSAVSDLSNKKAAVILFVGIRQKASRKRHLQNLPKLTRHLALTALVVQVGNRAVAGLRWGEKKSSSRTRNLS